MELEGGVELEEKVPVIVGELEDEADPADVGITVVALWFGGSVNVEVGMEVAVADGVLVWLCDALTEGVELLDGVADLVRVTDEVGVGDALEEGGRLWRRIGSPSMVHTSSDHPPC
eukprot:gb/GECG01002068.1/.p1 GENE.gb/GECG01002068.1/~~gb/GECG01002068.1/.p1  ORF type:complete len:116 (+),score=14.09 gb/GECG01002068.1/:1-348(+)